MEAPLSCLSLRYGDDAPDFVAHETYVPDDPGRREYGQLFVTLRLSHPTPNQSMLAPAILETLRDAYFADPNVEPTESFERALKLLNDKLLDLLADRLPDAFTELHVAIAVLAGDVLHATVAGDATVYLKRGPALVCVSEGLVPGPRTVDADRFFFQIASGEIRHSDNILLATHDLLAVTTEHHVRAALQPQNFRTPRLLKAKLGIRDPDLVLLLTGETLSVPSTSGSQSWTDRVRGALLGARAPSTDTADGVTQSASDENPEPSTKLSKTWALLSTNLRRSWEAFARRFTQQPLSPRSSRNAAVVTITVLLVLVGALLWGMDYRSRSTTRDDTTKQLEAIVVDRQTAQTQSMFDRATAKTVLSQALERAQALKTKNTLPDLAADIDREIAMIQESLNRVDNIFIRPEPRLIADLAKDRSGISPKGLFLGGTSIWAYDYNALYKIDLDKVERRKVALTETDEIKVRSATYLTQNSAVVLLTEDNRILEYKSGAFTSIDTDAQVWRTGTAIAEYDQSPVIYLLDPAGNQLWKYKRGRSTYSTPAGKVPSGTTIDGAVSVAVDGAIYILEADGTMVKTYNDKPAPFSWEAFTSTSALRAPTSIFTDSNTSALYVLEPSAKRVVVTTKSGRYLAQYVLPNAGTLVATAAKESENTLYVLEDSGKLWSVVIERLEN